MNISNGNIDETIGSKYDSLDNSINCKPKITQKELKSSKKINPSIKQLQNDKSIKTSIFSKSSNSFSLMPSICSMTASNHLETLISLRSSISSNLELLSLSPQPHLIQEKILFLSKNLKHCLRLYTNPSFPKLNSNVQSFPLEDMLRLKPLLCTECHSILITINLSCTHPICLNCFNNCLKSFIEQPSLPLLKNVSCPECYQNFSLRDIEIYSAYLTQFQSVSLEINCEICNLTLEATQNYWSESPCFHNCSNCYADCLMMNIRKCNFCGLKFSEAKSSLRRKSECQVCKIIEKSVVMCHRNVNGIRCFKCLQNLATSDNKSITKKLSLYINKKCAICRVVKNIADLVQKSCCSYPICDSCSPSSTCLICDRNN